MTHSAMASKKPVPHIPFHAHAGGGVRARGTVHEIRRQEDGKSHQVTIRHEDPEAAKKRKDPMAFDAYNHETKATMKGAEAAKFHVGQPVHVTIAPAADDDPDDGAVQVGSHTRSKPSVRRARA